MKDKKTKEQKTSAQADKKELTKLRQQTEELQKERDELLGKLQRVSADYANYQKRTPKQIADTIAYEKEKIIKSLLPAMDNLEHTLLNAHCAEQGEVLIKGIKIIYDQVLDILRSHNVEQIKALGEKFDPSLHQAMMQRFEADSEEDTVVEEFQKGYRLNGRTIRPSRVIVNKKPAEKPQEQQQAVENEGDGEGDDEGNNKE